jgi:hypothetical protein
MLTAVECQVRLDSAPFRVPLAPRVRAPETRARALVVFEAFAARAPELASDFIGGQAGMVRVRPEEERVVSPAPSALAFRELVPEHPRGFVGGRPEGHADTEAVSQLAGESRFAGASIATYGHYREVMCAAVRVRHITIRVGIAEAFRKVTVPHRRRVLKPSRYAVERVLLARAESERRLAKRYPRHLPALSRSSA